MAGEKGVRPNSISLRCAYHSTYKRIGGAIHDADPAPWHNVSDEMVRRFAEGDPETFIRNCKIEERAKLMLLQGLLSGHLCAHFSNGDEDRDVPGWAWHHTENEPYTWGLNYRLQLSLLLPDEWQRWSGKPVFLDQAAFSTWLDDQDPTKTTRPDELPPPHDAASRPADELVRTPPNRPFITLAEALSWIAFGYSWDRDCLCRALDENVFGQPDTKRAMEAATEKLTALAGGGEISMRGKFLKDLIANDGEVFTEDIEPIRLADFAEYDCLIDGFRYGKGLYWEDEENRLNEVFGHDVRREVFVSVTVCRSELMSRFSVENFDHWSDRPRRPRPSHEEIVQWCVDWMLANNCMGEKKAWPQFANHSRYSGMGLSRDQWFRPAWKDAKEIVINPLATRDNSRGGAP